jgi:hypothetical protein
VQNNRGEEEAPTYTLEIEMEVEEEEDENIPVVPSTTKKEPIKCPQRIV